VGIAEARPMSGLGGRRLGLGLMVLAALSTGCRTGNPAREGEKVLTLGESARTSDAVVTVTGWEVPTFTPPRPNEREDEEEDEEKPPPVLPGHVISAVDYLSCPNESEGGQADVTRFQLIMPDGSKAPPAGVASSRLVGKNCVGGLILFQTPEGERPSFVVFESSPLVKWRVPSSA
jgi:hypothetical protein